MPENNIHRKVIPTVQSREDTQRKTVLQQLDTELTKRANAMKEYDSSH